MFTSTKSVYVNIVETKHSASFIDHGVQERDHLS